MRFVIAVIIFSVVILIHELGHFLLAKKNHIEVVEFSLGMGPRIISTVKGGTRYSVKLLPLGGSCAMAGEDAEDDSPGTFNSAPVWGRIAVVAAGPVFNFLLAFVLSVIIVGCIGYDPATVLQVTEGSAAEKAGLKEGDVITEYQGYHIDLGKDLYVYSYLNELKEGETIHLKVKRDGKEQEISYKPDVNVRYLLGFNRSDVNSMTVESLIKGMPLEEAGLEAGDVITKIGGRSVHIWNDISLYNLTHSEEKEVEITYKRDGKTHTAVLEPRQKEGDTAPLLGVTGGKMERPGFFGTLKYGAYTVKYWIDYTVDSLRMLVTGRVGMKDLSGPVGIVSAVDGVYQEAAPAGLSVIILNLMNIGILITANLGVMNLLPLPALDGGRLVFLIIEAIRGKRVSPDKEGMVHFAGFALLMVLMVVVMFNDIMKLV